MESEVEEVMESVNNKGRHRAARAAKYIENRIKTFLPGNIPFAKLWQRLLYCAAAAGQA